VTKRRQVSENRRRNPDRIKENQLVELDTMTWKTGQSGNPTGRPVNKPFLDALNRAIAQDDAKKLRAVAEKLLEKAADGQRWAIRELADRLDGKAHQSIGGPEGGAVLAVIERVIVNDHPAD
jgi:hypothetical protein